MVSPYIRHGNIFVVPIIHHRINFAVLVHRAASDAFNLAVKTTTPKADPLHCRQDLVAVALPDSIRSEVEPVVRAYPKILSSAAEAMNSPLPTSELPKVALVIAKLSGDEHREVFPVSPCDGVVEAIRLALEYNIPLEFVDRNIEPGHLALRSCQYEPDWSDDSLVLRLGAEPYLKSIKHRVSQPPNRTEPLDTWREFYIADRLRRLQPRYRRILFVCDAKLVDLIGELLESRGLQLPPEPKSDDFEVSTSIVKPTLDVILQYLDDFPSLVEVYEQNRRQRLAADFDKWSALLQVLFRGGRDAIDLRASARKYRTAVTLLRNLLENTGRIAPSPSNVFQVFSSCFSSEFAQRVLHHLAAYRPQVKITNLAPFMANQTDIVALMPRDDTGTFVTRFCIPFPPAYSVARRLKKGGDYVMLDFVWPPLKSFWNRMRKRAYEAVRGQSLQTRITNFRGSLESGIDIRRTMRSHYKGVPQIFIKSRRRLARRVKATGEPTAWILRPERCDACHYKPMFFGLVGGPRYTVWETYGRSIPVRWEDERVTELHAIEVYGLLAFCDSSTTLREIKSFYGEDFDARIPESVSVNGGSDKPWWESMILTALKYAKHTVVCIAPTSLQIGEYVHAEAAEFGKSVTRVPLSLFGRDQNEVMQRYYSLSVPCAREDMQRQAGDDLNNGATYDYITQNYGHVLRGLPGVVWE
jgi:hypothetical protein